MMIDKRLIKAAGSSKKYVAGNVLLQWCSLLANMAVLSVVAWLLAGLFTGQAQGRNIPAAALLAAAALALRFACTVGASRMSYLSSRSVKKDLREKIYRKLLRLGASYHEQVKTSEVVQMAVEGVDQLEIYFGAYLPQFFYAMLAPLTLFACLCFVNVPSAAVLLACVPLIPAAIAAVQTWAKKLLSKYWGEYTTLGDTFLENLQGLTTLKIYQADELKQQEMKEEAERFRRITMKVLTMQLNSVTIMDMIAYGGAALGIILSVTQYGKGHVSLFGCLLIILLSADFFLPMRQLGSFFHIAMNGMAASDKIFRLLDLPEPAEKTKPVPADCSVNCTALRFSYEKDREILHGIDLSFPAGSFTALVGASGCGKSTVAAILMGRNRGYEGCVTVGGVPLKEINETSLLESFTYVSHQSYLFQGTVEDNLRMGKPDASEEELWQVLDRVRLSGFLKGERGLDTPVAGRGSNLSGGQCQRLALARALLRDSRVYIFDEATSNIDVESENDIMEQIDCLAKTKTVLLISHRLANVTGADRIYVMERGSVAESGTHQELLQAEGAYAALWNAQQALENYGKDGEKK